MQHGLVHGGVVRRDIPIPIRGAGRVLRHERRVVGVGELVLDPQRGSVMEDVDDGADAELAEAVHHPIRPRPVPSAALGGDDVPGDAPAHELGADGRGETEVLAPLVVVLRERVLVDGALAGALLRDEGVLDAEAEVQAAVAVPGHRGVTSVR